MIDDLLYRLGVKQKPRHEKVKDAFSDAIHTVADALDELVEDSRKGQKRVAKKARRAAEQVIESVGQATTDAPRAALHRAQETLQQGAEGTSARAGEARAQVAMLLTTLLDQVEGSRERAVEAVSGGAEQASKKSGALLAALGALTADWDELAKSFAEELTKQIPTDELAERAHKAKQQVRQATTRTKRRRAAPSLWFPLLRLGMGYRYIEALRGMDYSTYINEGASRRMRAARENHPVEWYGELLDTTLIPNASLVALGEVAGSALVGVGYITGINRRLAGLLGLLLTGNNLMLDYRDHDKRGEHLVALIAQMLLLRTGG